LALSSSVLTADDVRVVRDIAYRTGDALSAYQRERCRLDLYLPADRPPAATMLWFHGGALTHGNKSESPTEEIARSVAREGLAVASADYRQSPKTSFPGYIEDAAAAFAWLHEHIADFGGRPEQLFAAGHSAGSYLATMIAMDPRYLARHDLAPRTIAGIIAVSGHMVTHITVRRERGVTERSTIVVDDAAPIHYARADTPPMLVLVADHDIPTRLEENRYFAAVMRAAGNTGVELHEIADRNHMGIAAGLANPADPAREAVLAFVKSVAASR
jgi:acetyl esterase/lipase